MKHIALTPFGRQPVTAALIAARHRAAQYQEQPPADAIEKWAVFDDLRVAKAHFGLSDRDLTVLHALLSFLPAKIMKADENLVVFASNASLSERAHGMAESTLRRHLAALVQVGVIWRQDSSNGKRYAAKDHRGVLVAAFGLDLQPLLLRSVEIGAAANEVRAAEAELQLARQALVLRLRDCGKLIQFLRDTDDDLASDFDLNLAPLRMALRRKLNLPQIQALKGEIDQIFAKIMGIIGKITEDSSGSAAQNDRHYSNSNIDSQDLNQTAVEVSPDKLADEPEITLPMVMQACPDVALYSASPIRNWREFLISAENLHGMIGITGSVWLDAKRRMGPVEASVTLAAILQRIALIQNPNGYLRKLTQQAGENNFSPTAMILTLLKGAARQS